MRASDRTPWLRPVMTLEYPPRLPHRGAASATISRHNSFGTECPHPVVVSARRCMTPKLDPLLGLHFRNVLGDALCAERRLARCRRPRLACAVDAHDAVVRAQLTCFRGRGV